MRIDYSLPQACSKRGYLEANIRYGYRHLYAAALSIGIKAKVGVSLMNNWEICAHIVTGIAEMIPVIGHIIALADQKRNHRSVKIIQLSANQSPREMGRQEGALLKEEIQLSFIKILALFKKMLQAQGKDPLTEARALEEYIPEEYIEEMRGLAEGACVSYEDILIGNTIFDTMSLFGCSLYAASYDPETRQVTKEMATNYFHSLGRHTNNNVDQSHERYEAMQNCPSSIDNEQLKKTLLAANYYDTVQSIIFDPQTRDIHLATAGQYAANTKYTCLNGNALFGNSSMQAQGQATGRKIVKLARNLDWPLPFLGPLTTVIVRPASLGKKATAIVGWPGLIGAFSGINQEGMSVAISVVPSRLQAGTCNPFIFRKILEGASDLRTAENILDAHKPASPMNLCVAARDGIGLMELDPARKMHGAAFRRLHAG